MFCKPFVIELYFDNEYVLNLKDAAEICPLQWLVLELGRYFEHEISFCLLLRSDAWFFEFEYRLGLSEVKRS